MILVKSAVHGNGATASTSTGYPVKPKPTMLSR
jgi:hypothetical protein